MATAIESHTSFNNYSAPLMIGIKTGGAWVANRLHQQLEYTDPLGELNIAFYRDDFQHPRYASGSESQPITRRCE